jgi:rubrerythrin
MDFPKVRLFESVGSFEDILFTAMEMERGAGRFYQHVRDRYADAPFANTFDQLSKVETAHARIIYDVYKKSTGAHIKEFDAFYESLADDILEGGERLEEMTGRLESLETDVCISLMEIALNIEYAAYDLYRSAATSGSIDPEAVNLFLDIAQAEKNHMRMIAGALADCPVN